MQKALTCGINVTGSYLVTDDAKNIWQAQRLKNSLVVTIRTNVVIADALDRGPDKKQLFMELAERNKETNQFL